MKGKYGFRYEDGSDSDSDAEDEDAVIAALNNDASSDGELSEIEHEIEEMEDGDDDDDDDDEEEDEDEQERQDDEEDEVVQAIKREREKKKTNHPPDLKFDVMISDICFHPQKDLIATAHLSGDVVLTKYMNEATETVKTFTHHRKSCRDVEFSDSGNNMFTAAKDNSVCICDVETTNINRRLLNAHESAVCRLLVIDENTFASGDDDGVIKVWDLRQEAPTAVFKKLSEYVTDMATTDAKKVLACVSGEACLTAFNLRAKKFEVQSEEYDADLNCLGLVKQDSKLIVGSATGKMYVFNWGEFGLHSDMYPGHREAINSLVPITENIVVTALEDGTLRAVNFFPHKYLGIVGQHDSSAEKVDICNNGELLASFSEDGVVKFWNIKYFEEMDIPINPNKPQDAKHNLPSSNQKNVADFFSGLAE